MQPKVSIIVPCYGVEKYLDRCMESLVNQTLRDIEIILVDDVSPDRVPEMCDEWKKKDDRIKVIHKEKNGGLGFARNTGLEVATGEYVAFVDSDDYVDVNMYKTLVSMAVLKDADVVYCGYRWETQKGCWIDVKEVDNTKTFEGVEVRGLMHDMIACAPGIKQERRYSMSVWHSIYRRSVIDSNNIKFESERVVLSEDMPFQIDFLRNAKCAIYIPDALYYYCLNGGSLTTTYKSDKFERFKKFREVIIEKMGFDDQEGKARANRFFIGYCRAVIPQMIQLKYPGVKHEIQKMVNDSIWDTIKREYSEFNLSGYQRLVYTLLLKKNTSLLYAVSFAVLGLKRFKKVKV